MTQTLGICCAFPLCISSEGADLLILSACFPEEILRRKNISCLLYTSDAADEL